MRLIITFQKDKSRYSQRPAQSSLEKAAKSYDVCREPPPSSSSLDHNTNTYCVVVSGPYLNIPQVDYEYYCKIPVDFWISFLFPEGWILPINVFQSPQMIEVQLCSPGRMTPDWMVSFRDGAHVDCGALSPSQSMWGREIPGSSVPRKYVTLVHRLRWVGIVIRGLYNDIISYIKSMHANWFWDCVWQSQLF